MNYKEYLDDLTLEFKNILDNEKYVYPIPTEDFGWQNYRYECDIFRLAHIERYSDNKIEVLHLTTFPHCWDEAPIFGLDIITTENTIIGCYMDMSPTLYLKDIPFDEGIDFQDRKPIPEWATVFSDRFILLKPKDDAEFKRFCDWATNKYVDYLHNIIAQRHFIDKKDRIIESQNKYCEVQSKNPRTLSVLKNLIGEERAKYFMENILFPKIK
jgi:hypothetical protein